MVALGTGVRCFSGSLVSLRFLAFEFRFPVPSIVLASACRGVYKQCTSCCWRMHRGLGGELERGKKKVCVLADVYQFPYATIHP